MKTNNLLRFLALAVALLAVPPAQAKDDLAPLGANVEELLQWADTHNPELAAQRFEIDAASERIVPAGALPDPTLRVEFMDFAGPGAPDGFNPLPGQGSGTKYTVMQSFPWWGKRDLRKEVATAGLEEAKGRRQAAVADIHARIKSTYAQYYQAVGLKKLAEDILRLLGELEAVTQARYAGGLTPQQDVIRAQVEKTALRAEIITLETERHHAMARLNAALGRPQRAPVAEPQTLRRVPLDKLDSAALQEKAQHGSPLVATQAAQVSAADATRRLVERDRYPDVTLGIAPTQRGGGIDSWEAMVEFNIPLRFDTRRAREGEAGAMLAAARERRQSVANQVAGDLQEALAALDAAVKQEQLIDGTLLPQAELTFRSALAGYESGKVDFATLLDAQRAIQRARQDRLKAQVEQEMRVAEIEKMIGEEL